MKTKESVIKPLPPWRGEETYRAIAARVGRSKSHVYRVIKGERHGSAALRALLAQAGYLKEGK